MAMPSASVCDSGFSQKMSFFALAAAMAGIECQWSGVEITTASMSVAGDQFAEVLVGRAVLVAVPLIDVADRAREVARVEVAAGQHAAVGIAEELAHVARRPAMPMPMNAQRDFFRRGVGGKETAGQDHRDGRRGGDL